MIELFDLLAKVLDEAFSWLVYPIRIPLLTVSSTLLLWGLLRGAVPRLSGAADWTGAQLSQLLGTVLFAPEYACTLLLIGQGRGIPLVLRIYGEWVENLADWTEKAGRGLGRAMKACSRVSFKAVGLIVVVYLALYNVHALGSPGEPAAAKAPVVVWWDSFKSWAEADEHHVLEDDTPTTPAPSPKTHPSPRRSKHG
ncbi:hypothetical protein [Streptomyces gilvus]|uniref:hypothetical protein n=1 Tax=Streptomyces gilvus TaxID=2920937 RepID=UPI001F0DEFA3|nr:hypothetical protein [Streptomyces sp. CME 23]MCH5677352.1 hypothetical protein [Streptomyces sp. CME 23]